MKKALTIILTLALVMSLSVPAFAATNKDTTLNFTPVIAAPEFTVSIPPTLDLAIGNNGLKVEVQLEKMIGQYDVIEVTFEGTQNSMAGRSTLSLSAAGASQSIRYSLIDALNNPVPTHEFSGTLWAWHGALLAAFDYGAAYDAGVEGQGWHGLMTANLTIRIDGEDVQKLIDNGQFRPGETYTGTITFGISYKYNAQG